MQAHREKFLFSIEGTLTDTVFFFKHFLEKFDLNEAVSIQENLPLS